jgi:hypothetical protein
LAKFKTCLDSSESDPDVSQLDDPFLRESDTEDKETFQNPYLRINKPPVRKIERKDSLG